MKADAIGLLMFIDTIIYRLVDYVYDIFNALAKINIFDMNDYKTIVSRIYVILGMVMLFSLAYSLLKAVINPDEFAKGENSFPKLIKNVIISLAIIAVLPTAFSVAFNLQNTILNQNTIPKLVFGNGTDYDNATREDAGEMMSYYVMTAFLHPNVEWCDEKGYEIDDDTDINLSECASKIKGDGAWLVTNGEDLKSVTEKFKAGTYDISAFNDFGESAAAGKVTYNVFISTVAGVFLLYVLLNFCFDMAVRVVKLMFFQIIAPIPVICRVIPGGKLKDVFSDWMKKTISTYVEVFIRIAIMYLGVFMISQVVNNFSNINFGSLGVAQKLIAEALIIMGVVIFMRQAPKLIGDMFHLDSGSMKLGLMDKLAMGGALAAGSVAGGALGMLGRNTVSAVKGIKKADTAGGKIKAGLFGAASVAAGTVSGARRGFKAGKGAKSLADMKKAAGTAVADATAAKGKRDAYRAAHPSVDPHRKTDFTKTLAGFYQVGKGHIVDTAKSAGSYFGIGDELQNLQAEQAVYQEGMGFKKKLFDLVADNERVLAYQGLKKTAQEKDINNYISDIEKQISARGFSNKDNTGYFKVNNITGQKEYYKDVNGHILNDLTSTAIEQKTADIKMYDDAIKLASLNTIYEKVNKGDGRFTAVFNEEKVWKEQHADMPEVSKLFDLGNLDAKQISAINSALTSNNAADIKQVLDALEGVDDAMKKLNINASGIMSNDKNLKVSNGNVADKIAKKVQEKKKDSK